MKVCVDPGHGGLDPGATRGTDKEADFNLSLSRLVEARLRALQYDVVKTHNGLGPVKLKNLARCKVANDAAAAVYVAVHCNAARSTAAHGHEVIHCPNSIRGSKLAKCVQGFLCQVIPPRPRPVITDEDTGRGPYTVLRRTRMAAIIVECGFITNEADRKILKFKQKDLAEAIANGVDKYFKEV